MLVVYSKRNILKFKKFFKRYILKIKKYIKYIIFYIWEEKNVLIKILNFFLRILKWFN